MFFRAVNLSIHTRLFALRLNLFHRLAALIRRAFNVMRAKWHSVGIASIFIVKITANDNTSGMEPIPRSSNLASIATLAHALKESAASGSISSTQKSGEFSFGLDAKTVIVSLSGAMGPAGSTIGLISDVTNHIFAFWPGFS